MEQLLLFSDDQEVDEKKQKNSGTFVNNMKLPIHRWFRYSAGFSSEWVEQLLSIIPKKEKNNFVILDPFAGSCTTLISADKLGIPSIGIEAHPFVSKIAQAKLLWTTSTDILLAKANSILGQAKKAEDSELHYPDLIHKCFDNKALTSLDKLKKIWLKEDDNSSTSVLIWLAITSILRRASTAGTAQWQYILPNKTKKIVTEPFEAFEAQIGTMITDMQVFQKLNAKSKTFLIQGDARNCPEIKDNSVDMVITSPPYANNYDYADATRFEMTFWGEVKSWGDLHDAVRKYLIVSSSQHASKEKLVLEKVLADKSIDPIRKELTKVCEKLAEERLSHGGKKHYHTMIAAYFADMAKVWHELRRVCKSGTSVCFVIGDSAPYGVYVPVDRWLGELAISAGFSSYTFEKIRDRNTKWKNRKHRVLLHEGRLWVNDNKKKEK